MHWATNSVLQNLPAPSDSNIFNFFENWHSTILKTVNQQKKFWIVSQSVSPCITRVIVHKESKTSIMLNRLNRSGTPLATIMNFIKGPYRTISDVRKGNLSTFAHLTTSANKSLFKSVTLIMLFLWRNSQPWLGDDFGPKYLQMSDPKTSWK